jgi:hypothetical protein
MLNKIKYVIYNRKHQIVLLLAVYTYLIYLILTITLCGI